MYKVRIIKDYKSIQKDKEVELPDFCVLTGKNGSGKSQFLESMNNTEITNIIFENNNSIIKNNIKYVAFSELVPKIDTNIGSNQIQGILYQLVYFFNTYKNSIIEYANSEDRKGWFQNNKYRFDNSESEKYFHSIYIISERIKKNIEDLTENEIRDNFLYSDYNDNDAFSGKIASIFKTYQIAYEKNHYKKYRNECEHEDIAFLNDSDFENIFGPKPWIFLNDILKESKLPYQFNSPEKDERDAEFNLILRDINRNIVIKPNDLSTGEKVILSLALSIYNTNNNFIREDILLLDEPDAPLHPEFSKYLLDTINNHIVNKAGVKVIITTHSPTTVALANEENIYEMKKIDSIPRKVTKQQALDCLITDIPSLRVTIDNRRIIFVESNYDAENYEKIFQYVNKREGYTIQPSFFAPSGKRGTNCTDVVELMGKLENTDNVLGLIDYDLHNTSTSKVKVLGESGDKRYTIENYILDPLFVGLLLLQNNYDTTISNCTYVDFANNTHDEKQKLINNVCKKMDFSTNKILEYTTLNDEIFVVNEEWFTMPGHELEEKILTTWPKLNNITKGKKGDNILKCEILDKIVRDFSIYLSKDFKILFDSFI